MVTETVELKPVVTEEPPRHRRSSTVRVRLLGWYVALLGLSLVAALFLQRTFLLAEVEANVAEELRQEIGELNQLVGGVDPATGEPFGGDIAAIFDTFLARSVPLEGEGIVTFMNGRIYKTDTAGARIARVADVTEWGDLVESEQGTIVDPELGEIEYLAVPIGVGRDVSGVFVVTAGMDSRRQAINDVVRLGALVYGSIFLLASSLAWVAAGRILRPLSDLTDTAMSISDTDLSRRIAVTGDDEIAELGRTFNSMLDRLDEAFASQRRFVDDAGHELRTPITIIRGNLELMGDDPEERAATIALVTDELDRMTRIVDDLLDLAKAEQPDFVQRTAVDLGELTQDLVAKSAALDERPWNVESIEHVVVEADRHRLNQAMMNLIRNAVEHSPPGSAVHIGSRLDWRGNVRLWVRDEGEGIAEEDKPRLFERFARIDSGRRKTEGAGLGLAIVAAIAEAHDGSVTLETPEEGGNIFTISFPSRPPDHRE